MNNALTQAVAVAAVAAASGIAIADATGPDVVAFYVANDIQYHGASGGIGGYSFGTTSCNYGDQEADWYAGTNNTPLIGQNAYRLKDGRFEQIGLSWLKHSFCALSESGCGDCQSTGCETLGIGCADTYGAGLNANPSGPRSDVDAFSGYYDYPFNISNNGPSSIRGNLQIHNDDVEPSMNSGARYFFEGYYMSTDDAPAGNHANNASWREVVFTSPSSVSSIGNTEVGEQAIRKWAIEDAGVDLNEAHVAGDGFFLVGAKVTDLGGGNWHYEYAVFNHNCHAGAGSFSVPLPVSATALNIDFHDVDYHSGEVYDGTDWTATVTPGFITWETQSYSANPNANAIRWASMYNFRFDANVAPAMSDVVVGTFRPGGGASASVNTLAPPAAPVDPCDIPLGFCPEDIDGNHVVDVDDMLAGLGSFGLCGDGTFRPAGDVNGDCCVNVDDLLQLIAVWGMDCTPIGACCLPTGGCVELSEDDCNTASGDWGGEDTACDSAECPEPGACCADDGSCTVVMSVDCAASGGTFQGEGVTCEDTDCPVAGAGDECNTAFAAIMGENAFDTGSATPSSPEPDDAMCSGTYLDWGGSQDVWFSWTAATTELIHFTTCDATSYDTSMAIYENSCDNQVACNGDSSGDTDCQSYYSAIDLDVTEGSTYFIRLGGWNGETGSGTLTIE
ncbi:MAG: hypothetical protein GY876_00985 [Planctomycetes bacterium]|nr:hypothetical protein [Planctomycetota bacterium]